MADEEITELKSIRRADALREMETREGADGKRVYFSIQFYKKNGELVYFSRACTCGLRIDMKRNRMRGIKQCDQRGNVIGTPVAVSIDNIREFNHMRVKL